MASEDSDRPLAPQDATQFFCGTVVRLAQKNTHPTLPHYWVENMTLKQFQYHPKMVSSLLGLPHCSVSLSLSLPNGKFIVGFATLLSLSLSLIPFIAFYIHQHLYLHGDATCTYMFWLIFVD